MNQLTYVTHVNSEKRNIIHSKLRINVSAHTYYSYTHSKRDKFKFEYLNICIVAIIRNPIFESLRRNTELLIKSHFVSWRCFWTSLFCIINMKPWKHRSHQLLFTLSSLHFFPLIASQQVHPISNIH